MAIYETIIRNKFICTHAKSFDEFIEALEQHVEYMKLLRDAGVQLDVDNGVGDDYATFTTEDVEVAKRFGMLPWDYWDNPERYPEWAEVGGLNDHQAES